MNVWLLLGLLVGSGGVGGGIAHVLNARTQSASAAREQDRADDAADLAELRAIIAEQRGLIATYAGQVARVERLETTVKNQGVKILELVERDEECRRDLAHARARIDQLEQAA